MPHTDVVRTADDFGRRIVKVPLNVPRGQFAIMDEADFDAWLQAGLTLTWSLNGNGNSRFTRVQFGNPAVAGRRSTVARQLLGLGRGTRASYHDGDPLNLRRSNLRVSEGFAKGETKVTDEFYPTAAAA